MGFTSATSDMLQSCIADLDVGLEEQFFSKLSSAASDMLPCIANIHS